jgi:tetratricopeptide (TPR) repeat protein
LLEKAKLLYNLGNLNESVALIMSLIKKDPENAKYWIFLHIFTKNEKTSDMSKKALFRAYDIDPTNSLVLNSLIAYYYQNKEFVKFFKAVQVAQKLNYLNPNIISILTLLNA